MQKPFIGTSGWVYKSWAGTFYPDGLAPDQQLAFYAQQFPSVEINATFYRLPGEQMVQGWKDKAPAGFVYAVKASRFITHIKRLDVDEDSIAEFLGRIALLRDCLGPVLWQLPPSLRKDTSLLEEFLGKLPEGFRYAVEFRHPSWFDDDVTKLLEKFGAAKVSISSTAMPASLDITTDFVYLRFHGLADGFRHNYSTAELEPWADHCRDALRKKLAVYAYFNNDADARAPQNARQLMELLAG